MKWAVEAEVWKQWIDHAIALLDAFFSLLFLLRPL